MKKSSFAWLASLAVLCSAWVAAAEYSAVVKEGRVNVRGKPSLVGEVITQLQKGEKVVVLEEVAITNPKTNEPPRWARIQMPADTPVWVHASFIDPAAMTVKASRLNLRAGPGENFSVVGRLGRGMPVKEIRRVEDWLEIETPPGAYAFVAADLLNRVESSSTSAGALPAPEVKPAPVDSAPAPARVPENAAAEEPSTVVVKPPATVQAFPPQTQGPAVPPTQTGEATRVLPPSSSGTIVLPPSSGETTVVPPAAATTVLPPSGEVPDSEETLVRPSSEEAPARRVVRREGLVRSTVSIQAPTYYELLNPENRKTINYLHVESLGLKLKDYRGRRVIVTGSEAIDPRWPKTPVIEVEKLELIP